MVIALTGSAFAASGGLTGKQKKEVKKIAKSYAGKPGAKGDTGATGAAGTNGTNGKDGAQGPQGEKGATGDTGPQGPIGNTGPQGPIGATGPQGPIGNTGPQGPAGPEGNIGATLGSGDTETGGWAVGVEAEEGPIGHTRFVALSFPIPLAAQQCELNPGPPPVFAELGLCPGHAHYVTVEEQEEETAPAVCSGSAAAPTAASGELCVYAGSEYEMGTNAIGVLPLYDPPVPASGSASTAGALIAFGGWEEFGNAKGAFAVTG